MYLKTISLTRYYKIFWYIIFNSRLERVTSRVSVVSIRIDTFTFPPKPSLSFAPAFVTVRFKLRFTERVALLGFAEMSRRVARSVFYFYKLLPQ